MKVKEYFNFILVMTKKEIKARYKNTFLGFLWLFLNPLLQMLVMGLIFNNFVKAPTDSSYYLFIFSGLLPWNFFSLSITKATPSIVYERNLIQKAKFPREVIPLSIILSNFFNLIISFLILFTYLIITNNFLNSSFAFLKIILSIVWILLFTISLSLLTSSLNTEYRDVKFIVEAVILLWFYATPIIYPLGVLPKKLQSLFALNPLTFPLTLFRSSLLKNSLIIPSNLFLYNFFLSALIILAGILIFKKKSKNFSDYL